MVYTLGSAYMARVRGVSRLFSKPMKQGYPTPEVDVWVLVLLFKISGQCRAQG